MAEVSPKYFTQPITSIAVSPQHCHPTVKKRIQHDDFPTYLVAGANTKRTEASARRKLAPISTGKAYAIF